MRGKAKHTHQTDQEFPVLAGLGLYAGNITGDGNCLFRALSDQVYGNQDRYPEIRSQVIGYILSNRERFEPFTGIYDETFETYTKRMAQDATYGGHLEIVAFAEVHRAQVIIYQGEIKYAVSPQEHEPAVKVHIAYHTWEHYSSVRNKAGPHTGLPEVDPTPTQVERVSSQDVPQWQIDTVLRSVPECSEENARKLLTRKDCDQVIEDLLMDPHAEPAPEPEPERAQPKSEREERREARAEARREKLKVKRKEKLNEPIETPEVSDHHRHHHHHIPHPHIPGASRAGRKTAKKAKDFQKKYANKKEKAAVEKPVAVESEIKEPIFI